MPEYRIGDNVRYYGENYEIKDVKLCPMYKLQISDERGIWVSEDEVTPAFERLSSEALTRIIKFSKKVFDSMNDRSAELHRIMNEVELPENGWQVFRLVQTAIDMNKHIKREKLIEILAALGWRVEPYDR